MSSATCLCGTVQWELTGAPDDAYHCHCSTCRKAHGAAFGSYYLMSESKFRWIEKGDTVRQFNSSPSVTRAFCTQCGSVVPAVDGETIYVPAGPHDDGAAIDTHIFAASAAPWYDITDELTRYDAFPEGVDSPVYDTPEPASESRGHVRGSCLCRKIVFEVTEPFKVVHNCYCSRCRKARAAAFTTNGFTSPDGVSFLSGEDEIRYYSMPGAKFFGQAFCATCGSGVPRVVSSSGFASIPLGSLDDDPGQRPDDHIFVDDKADWFELTGDLPIFRQAPS